MKECSHDDVVGVLLQTSFSEGFNVAVDKVHIGLLEAKLLHVIVNVLVGHFQLQKMMSEALL